MCVCGWVGRVCMGVCGGMTHIRREGVVWSGELLCNCTTSHLGTVGHSIAMGSITLKGFMYSLNDGRVRREIT